MALQSESFHQVPKDEEGNLMDKAVPRQGSALAPIDLDVDDSSPDLETAHSAKRRRSSPDTSAETNSRKKPGATRQTPMAPMKLFRTIQMEKSLNESESELVRANTTTLRELLLADGTRRIQWIVIANFHVDFALLLEEIPELTSVDLTLCFYGICVDEGPLSRWKELCHKPNGSTSFNAVRINPSDTPQSASNPLDRKVHEEKNRSTRVS